MYRLVYEELLAWKNNEDRKPLILEGVRQCGKTYILKKFGESNYRNVVYLNFEGNEPLKGVFENDLDVHRIITQLALMTREVIEPGNTLIIFDEIQFCNRAITSLKYFCENAPGYHIACAGSLLGVLMSRPYSFPVGKVDRIRMWPMTFEEFLLANEEGMLVDKMNELIPTDGLMKPFATKLEFHLRTFLTVGGMPAVVSSWIKHKDINKVNKLIDGIMDDYKKDFAKHASGSIEKLTLIWNSVPEQLARDNKRFMFGRAKTGARAKDLEDALEWLINAGLLYKVKLADPSRLPIPVFADGTMFKLYLSDVGILRRMSGLNSFFDLDDEGFELFRGAVVENYVLNEIVAADNEMPFFWRSNGIAEVDFLITHGKEVIPIEVKSGRRKRSRSLKEYVDKFDPVSAVMTSMELIEEGLVKKIPLWWMWRYRAALPQPNE